MNYKLLSVLIASVLMTINCWSKSNVAILIGYDNESLITERQEQAACQLFKDLHPDGKVLSTSSFADADLSGIDCIWIHIDRMGLSKGWQNLPAEFTNSAVIEKLRQFHAGGGNLILTKHADQLTVAIGRIDAKFAPGLYGSGDGGRGTDVWCVQAQIGYLYGVPGTPEYNRDPSQYYDRRSHAIYSGLRTLTWLNGAFAYDTFALLGSGNGSEMHREDHNCMWDFNAYGAVYSSEGKNVVERFERDNNAVVLGQWAHVIDHAVGGIVEFLPQNGCGGIIANGLAAYELAPRTAPDLSPNAFTDNIRKLTQNCFEYYAMKHNAARIIKSDNTDITLTPANGNFEARGVVFSSPSSIYLNADAKTLQHERSLYPLIVDPNFSYKHADRVVVSFNNRNACYSLAPDRNAQMLCLDSGVYDFVFNDVDMSLTIVEADAPNVILPSDLPANLYLLGDPIQVGDFDMRFWDAATTDCPLNRVADKPGVFFIENISLGNGGFRFTDGVNAYVSDIAHLPVSAEKAVNFNLRKYQSTNDNFEAKNYDRDAKYTLVVDLVANRLSLFRSDIAFNTSSASTGYELLNNGTHDIHLFAPRQNDNNAFDAVSQSLSLNLGTSALDIKATLRPDGWAFANNPNHNFMGMAYAIASLSEYNEHMIELVNMRPGAYMLDVTVENAKTLSIPVHVCYSPLGFQLSGATVIPSNDAYTFSSGEFWGLNGDTNIFVNGHEYMRGNDVNGKALYDMWYRFTPSAEAVAPQMSANSAKSVFTPQDIPSGFKRHNTGHIQLTGLTSSGGNLEMFMYANGAINPRAYKIAIAAQNPETITAVDDIATDDAATTYYTLDGRQVAADMLTPGIYIVKTQHTVNKIIIK